MNWCHQIKLYEFNLDFKIMKKFAKVYFRALAFPRMVVVVVCGRMNELELRAALGDRTRKSSSIEYL